ncbi:MAG: hypothetical protein LBD24_05505 [Spirochaetaceae bacterium]|nr:hypothetical protein [Spirochaetaceae bacterium]
MEPSEAGRRRVGDGGNSFTNLYLLRRIHRIPPPVPALYTGISVTEIRISRAEIRISVTEFRGSRAEIRGSNAGRGVPQQSLSALGRGAGSL